MYFADADGKTAAAVKGLWERIKAEEKAERGEAGPTGALAGVPLALPALTRALKLQDKAGRVGFDWNDPRAVLAKIREEADEIEAALDHGDKAETAAEVGDLLFAVVNLARHLGADPEGILRSHQFEIRAPLCLDRARFGCARQNAEGCDLGRDGCAVGCGQGCGKTAEKPSLVGLPLP